MRRSAAARIESQDAFIEAVVFRLGAQKGSRILGEQVDRVRNALRRWEAQSALDSDGYLALARGHIQVFREWRSQGKTKRAESELYKARRDVEMVERCIASLEDMYQ